MEVRRGVNDRFIPLGRGNLGYHTTKLRKFFPLFFPSEDRGKTFFPAAPMHCTVQNTVVQ